jgi:hypothetical protein
VADRSTTTQTASTGSAAHAHADGQPRGRSASLDGSGHEAEGERDEEGRGRGLEDQSVVVDRGEVAGAEHGGDRRRGSAELTPRRDVEQGADQRAEDRLQRRDGEVAVAHHGVDRTEHVGVARILEEGAIPEPGSRGDALAPRVVDQRVEEQVTEERSVADRVQVHRPQGQGAQEDRTAERELAARAAACRAQGQGDAFGRGSPSLS